jgi:threonine aldolase
MATAPPVNLSLARAPVAPADALCQLAADAEALGVAAADVYGDFAATPSTSWLRAFEREVADHLGLEDAVFMPSGVMAQQIALCVHRERAGGAAAAAAADRAVLLHHSSHLLLHEAGALEHLTRLRTVVVAHPDPAAEAQAPLRAADVTAALAAAQAAGEPAPLAVVVEVPHREVGGKMTPWGDLVELSAACRAAGVAVHADGARLWEAGGSPELGGRSLRQLTAHFDSVYVSFYKGLGGLSGAMLLGPAHFCASARVWLRRFGGNLYTLLPYAVSGWAGFRAHAGDFTRRRARLAHVVALLTRSFCAPGADGDGGAAAPSYSCPRSGRPLLRFDPPVPSVSLVHVYFRGTPEQVAAAADAGAAACGVRVLSRVRAQGAHGAADACYFELNLGPANGALSDDAWVAGYGALLTALRAALEAAGA